MAPSVWALRSGHPPSRAFLVFQEFSHWNWDPEFPGGPCCQPPTARGWILHLESLLVSAPDAQGRVRCGAQSSPPAGKSNFFWPGSESEASGNANNLVECCTPRAGRSLQKLTS